MPKIIKRPDMAVDAYHTRDMNRKYDLNSKEEVSELNSLLNT
jgi:hypothetical protein